MTELETKTEKQEIGTACPIGKKNVATCIKSMGQYLVDNADKISENIDQTIEINVRGNISFDKLPTIEIAYTNWPFDKPLLEVAPNE